MNKSQELKVRQELWEDAFSSVKELAVADPTTIDASKMAGCKMACYVLMSIIIRNMKKMQANCKYSDELVASKENIEKLSQGLNGNTFTKEQWLYVNYSIDNWGKSFHE